MGHFLLGKCKDTVPPPEGRISTWDQLDLLGCRAFCSVLPCPLARTASPVAEEGSFPERAGAGRGGQETRGLGEELVRTVWRFSL